MLLRKKFIIFFIIINSLVFFNCLKKNELIFVEGGKFVMGNNKGPTDERPEHYVIVNDFLISKYEITQLEYRSIMGFTTPLRWVMYYVKRTEKPFYNIDWFEAVEYCNLRSKKEGLTPHYNINWSYENKHENNKFASVVSCNLNSDGYRLPTEAEWEYAAKGGKYNKKYLYSGSNNLDDVGYISNCTDFDQCDSLVHYIGEKKPNQLGLYDMTGNVAEWCWDWYKADYYSYGIKDNPLGPNSGHSRVLRGGGIITDGYQNTWRNHCSPDTKILDHSFRVCRSVIKEKKDTRYYFSDNNMVLIKGMKDDLSGDHSYYISKYEITQMEFKKYMNKNPSFFKGDNLPVEMVCLYDIVEFCNKKSTSEGLDPYYSTNGISIDINNTNGYRLPTKNEWFFAAKGGIKTHGYKFSGSNNYDDVGWYALNADGSSHRVGQKKPNEYGLFDMSGNVAERCWSMNHYEYINKKISDNNGQAYKDILDQSIAGGDWHGNSVTLDWDSSVFPYDGYSPYLGFRVARTNIK